MTIGRPTLPPGQRKDARVEVRLTPAGKAKLEELARGMGLSINAWIARQVDEAKVRYIGVKP